MHSDDVFRDEAIIFVHILETLLNIPVMLIAHPKQSCLTAVSVNIFIIENSKTIFVDLVQALYRQNEVVSHDTTKNLMSLTYFKGNRKLTSRLVLHHVKREVLENTSQVSEGWKYTRNGHHCTFTDIKEPAKPQAL